MSPNACAELAMETAGLAVLKPSEATDYVADPVSTLLLAPLLTRAAMLRFMLVDAVALKPRWPKAEIPTESETGAVPITAVSAPMTSPEVCPT